MKGISSFFICTMLALAGGCAVQPGSSAPVINDQFTIDSASLSTTAALTALGASEPVAQAPAARDVYEVANAVNQAAKTGISLADVQALAQSYLTKWNSPYDALAGKLVNMIFDQIAAQVPATTQPSSSILAGTAQELAIDLSQGVMNGSLPFAGGVPAATLMGAENRPGLVITVRHYEWKPNPR